MTHDDFESPQTVPVEITIGDKSRTYNVRELSAGEAGDLILPVTQGDDKQKQKAMRGFRKKIIATCITREDGSGLTEDDAEKMRTPLAVKLEKAAMKVNGMAGDEKKSPDVSDSGTSSPSDSAEPSAN
jgi:hypothetical protein